SSDLVTINIYNNTVAILEAPAFSSLRAGVKERTIPISVENNISQKKLLVKENFSSAGKWSVMYEVTGFAKSEAKPVPPKASDNIKIRSFVSGIRTLVFCW